MATAKHEVRRGVWATGGLLRSADILQGEHRRPAADRNRRHMTRLRQDLSYALRTFAKAPGFHRHRRPRAGRRHRRQHGDVHASSTSCCCGRCRAAPASWSASTATTARSRTRTGPSRIRTTWTSATAATCSTALMAHTFTMVGVPAGRRHARGRSRRSCRRTTSRRSASGWPPGARSPPTKSGRARACPVAIVTYARWKRAGLDPAFVGPHHRHQCDRLHGRRRRARGIHRHDGAPVARRVSAARHVRRRRQRPVQEQRPRPGGSVERRARRRGRGSKPA